jgi:hypothetical protein
VKYGIEKNCRFLLGDEMGVGKTVQALALSLIFKKDWPLLIICPSALVDFLIFNFICFRGTLGEKRYTSGCLKWRAGESGL